MEKDALTIATIIMDTETDYRGNLLEMVADILSNNIQGFTSSVIRKAAIVYGINPKI